jgi:hypothetical protein
MKANKTNQRNKQGEARMQSRGQSPSSKSLPKPTQGRAHSLISPLKLLWGAIVAFSVVIAYSAVWPTLVVTPDFSFDSQNAFNTSFSVSNEGLLPLTDLSITCTGNFVMHTEGNQFSGNFGTSTDYPEFSKWLPFKHRLSLPCNHNVVANGHPIDPGAKLGIKIRYKIFGLPIGRPQTFNFLALVGADNQPHWAYTE